MVSPTDPLPQFSATAQHESRSTALGMSGVMEEAALPTRLLEEAVYLHTRGGPRQIKINFA